MSGPFGALIFNGTGVASQPAPTDTGSEQWGTDGNGTSIRGSIINFVSWNKLAGEISAALQGFGIALSLTNVQQLLTLLQAGFAGIVANAPMPQISDCNVPSLGLSIWEAGAANTPVSGDVGILCTYSTVGSVTSEAGNALIQVAFDLTTEAAPFFRLNVNGGSWTAWLQLATQAFATAAAAAAAAAAQAAAETFATAAANAAQSTAETYANGNLSGTVKTFPGGFIIQSGTFSAARGTVRTTVNFGAAFPTACLSVMVCYEADFPPANGTVGCDTFTATGFTYCNTNAGTGTDGCNYIAMGH